MSTASKTSIVLAFTTLIATCFGQQPAPQIDGRWHRSYTAGPYSEVGTVFGGLYTSIPIFNLKGPGSTSLALDITHNSNQTPNTSFASSGAQYQVGAGWNNTLNRYIIAGVSSSGGQEVQEAFGGQVFRHWVVNNWNTGSLSWTSVARRPGCRGDLTQIVKTGVGVTGFTVLDQATRNLYTYDIPVSGLNIEPPNGSYMLDSVRDPHGNIVQYHYDDGYGHAVTATSPTHNGTTRLISVTDASNSRYVTFYYTAVAYPLPSMMSAASLVTPTVTRTWNFDQDATGKGLLATVRFPAPSSSVAQPRVFFHYTGETNIDRLWDKNGNRWEYQYGTSTSLGGVKAIKAFWKPYTPVNPATTNPAMQYSVTSASNQLPITIMTRGGPGWVEGEVVSISGIGGNLAANGMWTIHVISGSTFQLNGSDGRSSGSYQSGTGVVSLPVYDGQNPDDPANSTGQYGGATEFSWYTQTNNDPKLQSPYTLVCQITEHSGGAQYVDGSNNIGAYGTRIRLHIYYNGFNTGSYLKWPIAQVVDAAVSGDSQKPGAGYYETYRWNLTEGAVDTYWDRKLNSTHFDYLTGNSANRGLVDWTQNAAGYYSYFLYNSQDKAVTASDPTLAAPSSNPLNWYQSSSQPPLVRTIYSFDPTTADMLSTTVDPTYDPSCPNYSKSGAVNLVSQKLYNTRGFMTDQWSGTDSHTGFSNFDAYGDAWTVTDPSGKAATFTFDSFGNKMSETPPTTSGTTIVGMTSYYYDNWDRLIQVTHPGGSITSTTYDLNNNKTSVVDQNGHYLNTSYDTRNRVTYIARQAGTSSSQDLVTQYFYDEVSNRTAAKNPRGYVTAYGHDERNYETGVTYPDLTSRTTHYDGNGNIDQSSNAAGKTAFGYDLLNRLTLRTWPNGKPEVITYTPSGLRLTVADPTGTWKWDYTDAKQLKDTVQPLTQTVYYTYDAAGRRKTMAVGTQTWTYNYLSTTAYRLTSVTQTVGASTPVTYAYHSCGLLQSLTFGSGAYGSYLYDTDLPTGGSHPLGRLTEMDYKDANGTLRQSVTEGYDLASNAISYTDAISGGMSWTTSYQYDPADRLTSEYRTGGTGGAGNFNTQYSYDGNGNRSSATRNGFKSTYSVDANDKFLLGDGYTISSSNYDGDGNPKSVTTPKGVNTMTYDPADEVLTLGYGSGSPDTFRYDFDGRRVEKVDNTGTTRYVYDGTTVIADTDGTGKIKNWYLPGVGVVSATGVQTYFRYNPLGSSVATTDVNSVLATTTEYDGYGIEQYSNGSNRTAFRFVGKESYVTDDHSGLDMLGRRYYIPGLGRFLTQDPKGHAAGLNLYEYSDDNPLTHIDPSGLDQRALSENERTAVLHAITLLADTEQRRPAKSLERAVKEGRIVVDDGIEPYAGTDQPWLPWFSEATIRLHPSLFDDNTGMRSEAGIRLAGVLIHEWTHMDMQPKMNGLTSSYYERQAWSYQIRWLQMNAWDSKGWSPEIRGFFGDMAREAIDNLKEGYGLTPLKSGF